MVADIEELEILDGQKSIFEDSMQKKCVRLQRGENCMFCRRWNSKNCQEETTNFKYTL